MTINQTWAVRMERKSCEREENGTIRRRKHKRRRGSVQRGVDPTQTPSVSKGVITGGDVGRKDANKEEGSGVMREKSTYSNSCLFKEYL